MTTIAELAESLGSLSGNWDDYALGCSDYSVSEDSKELLLSVLMAEAVRVTVGGTPIVTEPGTMPAVPGDPPSPIRGGQLHIDRYESGTVAFYKRDNANTAWSYLFKLGQGNGSAFQQKFVTIPSSNVPASVGNNPPGGTVPSGTYADGDVLTLVYLNGSVDYQWVTDAFVVKRVSRSKAGYGYSEENAKSSFPVLGASDIGYQVKHLGNGLTYVWNSTEWVVASYEITLTNLPDPATDEPEVGQRVNLKESGSTYMFLAVGGWTQVASSVDGASKVTESIIPIVKQTAIGSATTWTCVDHGLADGDRIMLSSSGVLPTGSNAYTMYFVRGSTANTFEISLTSGGAAVSVSGGSGTHYFKRASYTLDKTPAAPQYARLFIQRTGNVFYGTALTDANTDYTIDEKTLTFRGDIVETFTPSFKPAIHIEYAI